MTLRRSLLFVVLLFLLVFATPLPAAARGTLLATDLAVQNLSVYAVYGENPQRITVSFRVVNLSDNPALVPFNTSVSPGANDLAGQLTTYLVNTPSLSAKQILYVSRTVTLPPGTAEVTVQVVADSDHVLYDPRRSNNVASTTFRAIPATGSWLSLGPNRIYGPPTAGLGDYNAVGRLAAIAIDPRDSNVIYVGSPGQLGREGSGVWKTADGGRNWQPVADSLPGYSIAAIAVDPGGWLGLFRHVYVLTSDSGLYRSDDDGTSWIRIYGHLPVERNTDIGDPTHLLIDPKQPSTLYLTTKSGVMRSKTGGKSWSTVLVGEATALVMDPVNTQVLYAATRGSMPAVWKTINGGDKWVMETVSFFNTAPRYGILLGLSHPASQPAETVYALMGAGSAQLGFKLYRSVGGGAWELRSTCSGDDDCDHSMVLDVDPADPDRVYLGGLALYIFGTGAGPYTRVPASGNDRQPASPHGDYHGWAIDPANPSIVYAATDGGIYQSTSKGDNGSWAFIGQGITNAEIYDVAVSGQTNNLIAGTQDSGTIKYTGVFYSTLWTHIYPEPPFGGDGGYVAMDPGNDLNLYAMVQDGNSLVASQDGGGIWDPLKGVGTNCANWNMTFYFQLDPLQAARLWASCQVLWSSANPIFSWTLEAAPPAGGPGRIVRSAIDPSNHLVYSGLADGRILAGTYPQKISKIFQHPYGLNVTDMEVDPRHPEVLYAAFSPPTKVNRNCALRSPRIYKLKRLKALPTSTSEVITDVTGNLPTNLCVNTIAVDPSSDGVLLAGTQKGVYRGVPIKTLTGGIRWRWSLYSSGMGPADVRDLEYQSSAQRMIAATFGRGVFMMAYGAAPR